MCTSAGGRLSQSKTEAGSAVASAMVLQASGTAPEVHLRERGFVVGVCGWSFVVGMGGQRFFVRDFYYEIEIRLRLRLRLRRRLLLLKLRLLRTTNIPRRGTSPRRRSRRSLARRRAWRPRGAWGPSGRRTEWGGAWGGGAQGAGAAVSLECGLTVRPEIHFRPCGEMACKR